MTFQSSNFISEIYFYSLKTSELNISFIHILPKRQSKTHQIKFSAGLSAHERQLNPRLRLMILRSRLLQFIFINKKIRKPQPDSNRYQRFSHLNYVTFLKTKQ